MTSLWRRLRGAYRERRKRQDEIAGQKLVVEHERQGREKPDPETPIPPMRSSNDWAGWSGPL